MFKKMVLMIVVLVLVVFADSPVKVKWNDFWWEATKHTSEKFIKSIKVEWDNEAALELMGKGLDKTKELTNQAIEKTKELNKREIQTEETPTPKVKDVI